MALDKKSGRKRKEDSEDLSKLTRQQLRDLEAREKTTGQKVLDSIIVVLPVVCGMIAILEYMLIPNGNQNQDIYTYLGLLIILIVAYIVYMTVGGISKLRGNKNILEKCRYRAPLFSALFLLLAGYDYLTLKTGGWTQAFVPGVDYIVNIGWGEKGVLMDSTRHKL